MTVGLAEYIGVTTGSDFDLATRVENGLPTARLAALRKNGLTFSEISEIVISPRTLKHRKDRKESLSAAETDRLVRTARVVVMAENIFGDREKALGWLRTPDERLSGRKPMSLLQTEAGGRVVENMLWQIDEGIYS